MNVEFEAPPSGDQPKTDRPRPLRLYVAIGGVVLTGLLVLIANQLITTKESWTSVQAAAAGSVRVVEVSVGNGDVRVGTGAGDAFEVDHTDHYQFRKPSYIAETDGDVLRFKAACRKVLFVGKCSTDLRVTVPPDTAVHVKGGNGAVDLRDLRKPVKVTWHDGSIGATGVVGAIDAEVDHGSIEGRKLLGLDVSAKTTGKGDVDLEFNVAPNKVEAMGGGDVSVRLPEEAPPYRVDAVAADGKSVVDTKNDPSASRSVVAHSAHGDVKVFNK